MVSSTNRDFGRLEGKVDLLLDTVKSLQEDLKATTEKLDGRIESLEVTRTKQRAYWRSLVVAGGVLFTLLGKLLFFTQRVAINVPPILPVK
jgi:hypothetical protein